MAGYDDRWFATQDQILEAQEELIAEEAQDMVDNFWSQIKARKSQNQSEGRIGCRVVHRKGGKIQIIWYEKRWSGPSGAKKLFSVAIARGKRNKYPRQKFSRFTSWEQELAVMFEEDFAHLRAASGAISQQRQSMKKMMIAFRSLGYTDGTHFLDVEEEEEMDDG
ncbi:conjugative transfer protein MobI(A/C) [Hydrocarboniclastica marina]|uniref:Uncharacterized protein n=1 Tax=Hydrocarboniclastica marina TaxID=2259620 RepID=A0A4P7XLG5_9ALTE|nr:conjugative transfer protein MobI(A/C) [Hydrocarboniclastica marina]QCF28089.1 hypothetical protein soil367_18625 [Hydrocarboniclastica marina]